MRIALLGALLALVASASAHAEEARYRVRGALGGTIAWSIPDAPSIMPGPELEGAMRSPRGSEAAVIVRVPVTAFQPELAVAGAIAPAFGRWRPMVGAQIGLAIGGDHGPAFADTFARQLRFAFGGWSLSAFELAFGTYLRDAGRTWRVRPTLIAVEWTL